MKNRAQLAEEAAKLTGDMSPQQAADMLKSGVTPDGEKFTPMTKRTLKWRATNDDYKKLLINRAAAARRYARRAA